MGHVGAELGLNTSESGGELSGCTRPSFDLGQGFMEHFGDIKKTDDVSFFVADGLLRTRNRYERGGMAGQMNKEQERTRCRKPLDTMSWRASVALVVSRVTIGFRVIMAETGVFLGSKESAVT